jgi:peptidoglycan-N-acetylglucosamine deacetylase
MTVRTGRFALRVGFTAVVLAIAIFAAYEFIESPENQLLGKTVVSGPADEKVVALTYDDGPNPPYTDRILDVLRRERVHATFFVVGRAVDAYPQLALRESREGHAIGNHTWDHVHLIMLTRGGVRDSLQRTDAAIFRATGKHSQIMRPPFGARDWIVLSEVHRLGYTPIMWSMPLPQDWEDPPPSVIAHRVLSQVHDGSIIVLHDGNRGIVCAWSSVPQQVCDREADIEATRLIVEALKRDGYRFVTIPELLQLRAMHTPVHGSE